MHNVGVKTVRVDGVCDTILRLHVGITPEMADKEADRRFWIGLSFGLTVALVTDIVSTHLGGGFLVHDAAMLTGFFAAGRLGGYLGGKLYQLEVRKASQKDKANHKLLSAQPK